MAKLRKTKQKRLNQIIETTFYYLKIKNKQSSYLCVFSLETVSFFLPFALLAANTLRPLADSILFLKPCLFFLRLLDG
jgi:hypothetical protein